MLTDQLCWSSVSFSSLSLFLALMFYSEEFVFDHSVLDSQAMVSSGSQPLPAEFPVSVITLLVAVNLYIEVWPFPFLTWYVCIWEKKLKLIL